MVYSAFIISCFLLAMGMEATATPQASASIIADSSSSASAQATPSPSGLPDSVLQSLPIIVVEGNSSSNIVQSSNSSLVNTHPELEQTVHDPNEVAGPRNITRRDECIGGPFASPITPWTNVKLLADRVCEFWFPNNQVSYVPAPLPAPGFVQVRIPFGPGQPTLNMKYQTVNPAPVTDLFTPLTSTICKNRFNSILAFAIAPGNFQCPAPPNVHAGDDCDVATRAACFTFFLT